MTATARATFHRRFLRIFIAVTLITVLPVTACLGVRDYNAARDAEINQLTHIANAVSQTFLLILKHRELNLLHDYLEAFGGSTSPASICLYSADNTIISSWHNGGSADCPRLLVSAGAAVDAESISIALQIRDGKNYMGMVYVSGTIQPARYWWLYLAKMFAVLFSTGVLASILAANLVARGISLPLAALRQQMECMRSNSSSLCLLPEAGMAQEIHAVSDELAALRRHFDTTTVPRETLSHQRQWHLGVLSGLLSMLRARLSAESPLVDYLSDYALLLQGESGDILPPARDFDLALVADKALASARTLQPPDARINLTVSLQPGIHRYFNGQPGLLEALLRHLLIIGLKRTSSGVVLLRIEQVEEDAPLQCNLRITMQDSGPPIQRGQLQQWLLGEGPPHRLSTDISWLLAARLFKRLGGALSGNSKADGLALEGRLALAPREGAIHSVHATAGRHVMPALVLVVENNKAEVVALRRLCAEVNATAFIVGSHQMALEWVPLLPFSAIILNADMADASEDAARRLARLPKDNAIPPTPLWLMTTRLSNRDFEHWCRQGINDLLLKPIQPRKLSEMLQRCPAQDEDYYLTRNHQLQLEIGTDYDDGAMTNMLAQQVQQIDPVLEALAKHQVHINGRDLAHGVRSAALTLGYLHLAALMGQIEHAHSAAHGSLSAENCNIVRQLLRDIPFRTVSE